MLVVCCVLIGFWWSVFVLCWLLSVVRCSLLVVCCLLLHHAEWCRLCVSWISCVLFVGFPSSVVCGVLVVVNGLLFCFDIGWLGESCVVCCVLCVACCLLLLCIVCLLLVVILDIAYTWPITPSAIQTRLCIFCRMSRVVCCVLRVDWCVMIDGRCALVVVCHALFAVCCVFAARLLLNVVCCVSAAVPCVLFVWFPLVVVYAMLFVVRCLLVVLLIG